MRFFKEVLIKLRLAGMRRRNNAGTFKHREAGISIGPIRRRAQRDGTDCTASAKRRRRQDRRDQGVCLARALRRRVHNGAGAKIGAIRPEKASASLARFGAECKTVQAPRLARSIRTEKAAASLARFGAECKTAQAPRSARPGRMRRRPPSRASAPSANTA
ncbi:hypothetical protein PF001_g511 [Phytophthora fragariae]|uniref:Uncharacterized protein n=1 Tax=Phytophthora fragariae TaxID=53985 RepID=A0A6A3DZC2_9STRA|nr:hypothetical protein PF009_g24217 [Phytophthora fragariae]KAE9330181.1 hypothetical protein PF001_g511 [Phytophthora fragariae]